MMAHRTVQCDTVSPQQNAEGRYRVVLHLLWQVLSVLRETLHTTLSHLVDWLLIIQLHGGGGGGDQNFVQPKGEINLKRAFKKKKKEI